MGSSISGSIEATMKRNSEDMMIKQRDMQLKIREIQLATQFAIGKDRFHFFCGFYIIAVSAGIIRYTKTKNHVFLIPILPLTFMFLYQFDMYYLNKLERIRKDASKMINDNWEMFIPADNNLISEEEYKKMISKSRRNK